MKKIGLFAAGVLFGTAGMKREGADDVYAEAKAINAQRTEAETANVVEDTSAEEESQAE